MYEKEPRVSAIVAVGKRREIGSENKLLWKLDADYERMKRLTRGHPLIMGRKTYESIGMELPYAPSIVITRDTAYTSPYKDTKHTTIVHSLEEAFDAATEAELSGEHENKEIFIFGGAGIYEEALPQTNRLYITEIDAEDPAADSFFPEYNAFSKVLEEETHEEHGITFRLLTLER